MLLRFDPFRELDRVTEQIWGTATRPVAMPMDAYRSADHFVVRFDVPGVDPSDIDLTVERGVLTVSAERHERAPEGQEVLVAERPLGRFRRQIFLGDALDADHIEAHYTDGVLTVTIPVAAEARPRRVPVSAGRGEAKALDAQAHETAA